MYVDKRKWHPGLWVSCQIFCLIIITWLQIWKTSTQAERFFFFVAFECKAECLVDGMYQRCLSCAVLAEQHCQPWGESDTIVTETAEILYMKFI